jgi:hypothetical protein
MTINGILPRNVDFMSKQFRVMVLVAGLFIVLGSCEEPVSPAYNNPYDPGSRNFTPSPSLQTNPATQITGTTAVSGGTVGGVSAYNVTAKGVCVSLQPNPPLGSNCTNQGAGLESFTSNLTGLSPGTRYYIRAYVTIVTGTTTFGQQLEFFTTTATPPTLSTSAVSSITANSAVGGGNVTSAGTATVTARGICWSTTQNPTTSNSCVSSGSGTGSFTANMTGLSAGTLYYVRAYATSSAGTSYGSQVSFTTTTSGTLASLTTTAVTSITANSAVGGGNITSAGTATVTARGICWSTTQNPTTGNSCVSSGSGTGSFTANMTGLSAGTLYYVRAYATSTAGTSYGAQVSFTTTVASPSVTTGSISSVTVNTAVVGGSVTSAGTSTVTSRGICYATTQNPTTSNTCIVSGSGTGTYSVTIPSLTSGTLYYVRAFATNSSGTSYGTQGQFTTLQPQFTTIGTPAWFLQSAVIFQGTNAWQSGRITHNQSTVLQTVVQGPATVDFYWRVSSESGFDFLSLLVGTSLITQISGEVNWTRYQYVLPANQQYTIQWRYSKDSSVDSGADTGWVDNVVIRP